MFRNGDKNVNKFYHNSLGSPTYDIRYSHNKTHFMNGKSNTNNLNKSNISMYSDHIWNIMEDVQMFPQEFSEALNRQQINIKQFKLRIDKEKSRLNSDFQIFKKQIIHHIDDLRLSMVAELDNIYREYMERYAHFKGAVLDVKRMRDDIQRDVQLKTPKNEYHHQSKLSTSNINTIKSMQNGYKDLKRYQMLNYISQIQKAKLFPIEKQLRELITLTQYQNGFYLDQKLNNNLKHCKQEFRRQLRSLQQNKLQFLRQTQSLFIGKFQKSEQSSLHPSYQRQYNLEQEQKQQNNNVKQYNIMSNRQKAKSTGQFSQKVLKKYKFQNSIMVSPTQQTAVYSLIQQIKLIPTFSLKTTIGKTDQVSDIILCALVVNSDEIAIGSKDGILSIYSISSNERIQSLKGHNSSICSLALIKSDGLNYLASGSDYGCNCILVWEVKNWSLKQRLEGHKAAVTAIADLMDGQSIISGSYDKKINIYNLKQGKIKYNLPSNKSPVTSIILNNSGIKMISCGLDNSLNVWQIERSGTKKLVQTLFLQRVIQNNSMICSLVGSLLREDVVYIGTKDGKLKIINIEKGQSQKTISCCENAIIEMVVIQRQNQENNPFIIAWPCKQNCLKIVNTRTGKLNSINIKGHIQFGCGIGPKGLLLSTKQLAMLSQNQSVKQIQFYKIQNTFR